MAKNISAEDLKHILRLWGTLILSQRETNPEDIREMAIQIRRLNPYIEDGIMFTPAMAVDWFKANKETIQSEFKSQYSFARLRSLLTPLDGLSTETKTEIISCMRRLALLRGAYKHDQKIMIDEAMTVWGIKPEHILN